MNVKIRAAISAALVLALAGCSSVKKFTGQKDDTVLPGERETVLPPEQTRNPPKQKAGAAKAPADDVKDLAAPCDPEIEVCEPAADVPADDGAAPGGGVFQDG